VNLLGTLATRSVVRVSFPDSTLDISSAHISSSVGSHWHGRRLARQLAGTGRGCRCRFEPALEPEVLGRCFERLLPRAQLRGERGETIAGAAAEGGLAAAGSAMGWQATSDAASNAPGCGGSVGVHRGGSDGLSPGWLPCPTWRTSPCRPGRVGSLATPIGAE